MLSQRWEKQTQVERAGSIWLPEAFSPLHQDTAPAHTGKLCPYVQLTFIHFITLLINLSLQYISFNESFHDFLDRKKRNPFQQHVYANISFGIGFWSTHL